MPFHFTKTVEINDPSDQNYESYQTYKGRSPGIYTENDGVT